MPRVCTCVCTYGSEGVKNGWMGEICEGTESKLTSNSTAVHGRPMRVVHENSCVIAHQFTISISSTMSLYNIVSKSVRDGMCLLL